MATTTSCTREIHVGDIGTLLEVTLYDCSTPVDLTGATETTLILVSPTGVKTELTATFKTDGTDGILQYISDDETFTEAGTWKIQGFVILPAGQWSSDIAKFKVYANL